MTASDMSFEPFLFLVTKSDIFEIKYIFWLPTDSEMTLTL